ncbi:MAG: SCP2 sterol-binding domain-containing protein [Acidobacteriota bacterium]
MSETSDALNTIFTEMPGRLNAQTAAGMDAVIQYDLTGDDACTYHCAIKDGAATVNEGGHDAPTMTVTMAAGDFVDMIGGNLDGMSAFMTGKLKVSGDMSLAMKMQSLFT